MEGWKHTLAAGLLAAILAGGPGARAAEPIDINAASVKELAAAIEGVGEKKARAIVTDRERNGRFSSVDDLTRVSGISARMVEASRDKLRAD